MITKLIIRCYGEPQPPTCIDVLLTDGTKDQLIFDHVNKTRDGVLTTLTFIASQPIAVKPWRIAEFLTEIPGMHQFVDIYFTTDRFMVAFGDDMIHRFNNNM